VPPDSLTGLLRGPGAARHVEHIEGRAGLTDPWPEWAAHDLVTALAARGIQAPWQHQVETAQSLRAGRHTLLATGTASGKTLAGWLPSLTALLEDDAATVLYLAPTKALAHDQVRSLNDLGLRGVRASTYDGDTAPDERRWVRAHSNYVLTNPDLIHHSMLPRHRSWARFLKGLRAIVIDEAHLYRGVFGSHVALVLRRLRRLAHEYGADPVVFAASATMADARTSGARLIGAEVNVIDVDTGPRASLTAVLWQPPETPEGPRSTIAESADLLADLTVAGVRSLAFIRSRRGAETVAMLTRDHLVEVDAELSDRVAAYRGGYLPEERRELEEALRTGKLTSLATTNALELGIDISGLDAVLVAGWPGTRASLWQQWGRAGRGHGAALGIFVAREDPLDRYVLDHPEVVFGQPVESIVLDPANPHLLGPHLAAAAAERPLTDEDAARWFGESATGLLPDLAEAGLVRRRPTGWYYTRREPATDLIDLRGSGGTPIQLVEAATGRLLGTVDAGRAHTQAHTGAIYVHQGQPYLVRSLDLDDAVALLESTILDYSTTAAEVADYRILSVDEVDHDESWGMATVSRGEVEVTSQVVGFLKRRYATGEILGEESLDLPERVLQTRAVWWTVTDDQLRQASLTELMDIAGAAHAAEHASIGILPLLASCDRWDIGGVSTPLHPDTGKCTVMVYDGHPGGAGFSDRAFTIAREWLGATRAAIMACRCTTGCPACVQSPKCGNGNEPLDKLGAIRLLGVLLGEAEIGVGRQPDSVEPGPRQGDR
jgi:DEAD/DEAH box helicase domain-containing protein